MKFKNKVCIITGGAAGIGRCLAESFSAEGARVYVIDKEQVTIKNDLIHFFQGDIAEQTVIDTFIDWILAHEQQIDILINNACLMKGGILSGCTYDDFLYVQRVGEPEDIVQAAFFLCDERNSFINGTNLTVDGGMSKLMVYHNDKGWTLDK